MNQRQICTNSVESVIWMVLRIFRANGYINLRYHPNNLGVKFSVNNKNLVSMAVFELLSLLTHFLRISRYLSKPSMYWFFGRNILPNHKVWAKSIFHPLPLIFEFVWSLQTFTLNHKKIPIKKEKEKKLAIACCWISVTQVPNPTQMNRTVSMGCILILSWTTGRPRIIKNTSNQVKWKNWASELICR